MILRIQIKGNYLVGTENSLNDEIFRLHQSHVRYSRDRIDNFWFYDSTFNKLLGENTSLIDPTLEGQVFFPIADIRDSSGVAFASANVFETWLSTNTGKIFEGSGGAVDGSIINISSVYVINDVYQVINCVANTFTVTLPTAIGISGREYTIKNSGAGVITLDAFGTETIDTDLTQIIYTLESFTVVSDGANWIAI